MLNFQVACAQKFQTKNVKTKLPLISRWLLLVSVILQISNLKAILHSGHLFYAPCIINRTLPGGLKL